MKLFNEPPLYSVNGTRPENIVGSNYDLFVRHFLAWGKNETDPAKVEKMFSEHEQGVIGEINLKLLHHGYRARYVRDNRIVFGMVMSGNRKQILPQGNDTEAASSPDHARTMIQKIKRKLGLMDFTKPEYDECPF